MPQPHEQRVIAEKDALDVKRIALDVFITNNPTFGNLPGIERMDLRDQLSAMNQYSAILGRRISRFAPDTAPVADDLEPTGSTAFLTTAAAVPGQLMHATALMDELSPPGKDAAALIGEALREPEADASVSESSDKGGTPSDVDAMSSPTLADLGTPL
jgi:hypothetical protein